MNRYILSLTMTGCFLLSSTQLLAATEPYFATGEDIDNLIDDDNASGLFEMEEKLSEFPLFRTLEEYFLNITYATDEEDEYSHIVRDAE